MHFLKKLCPVIATVFLLHYSLMSAQTDTIYFFSHGLGGNKKQAYHYQQEEQMIGNTLITFDFPDVLPHGFNAKEVNLGQEQDVATVEKEFEKIKGTQDKVVLFGVSRGAATLVNFLGKCPCPEVKAVILESPFDHVQSVIEFKYYVSAVHALVPMFFAKYNPHGMQPITSAPTIRTDVPILIICSEQDSLIPCSSSIALYRALKKAGNNHVHLLNVAQGDHGKILWGAKGAEYRNVVHAFYKKYNLPYNGEFAALGQQELAASQP
jgi:alpha-beta hydrolase superfamily lysophospholipase